MPAQEDQTNAQKVLHVNVHTIGTYAYVQVWRLLARLMLSNPAMFNSSKVPRVDAVWVHSARQCQTLLYYHVGLCMTIWFHVLRSSKIFEAFSKPPLQLCLPSCINFSKSERVGPRSARPKSFTKASTRRTMRAWWFDISNSDKEVRLRDYVIECLCVYILWWVVTHLHGILSSGMCVA